MAEHTEELAALETAQHGSPIRKTMNFDLPQCADTFEYFAGVGRALTGDTLPVGPWAQSITVKEPLGVIGLITPWNFPTLMVVWKMAAALITGNTCIIKPPSVAPLTTLRLAELAVEAGIPGGAVNVLTGPGETVGEAIVVHPGVAKIGFTGDTSTGKRIMKLAADTAKPVGLELGGNNAFVVLDDADVDAAVEGAIFGSFFNSGQVCAASSRLFVHESLYDQFCSRFVAAAKQLRIGDPMDPMTVIGPVPFASHRDKIESYVASAKAAGATLLLEGGRPDTADTQDGYFVLPTIFGDADNQMEFMQHEVFGPVVGIQKFATNEEALALANGTNYGLSASVWTKDLRTGLGHGQPARGRHGVAERAPDPLLRHALGRLQGVGLRQGPQHHGPRGVRAHQAHLHRPDRRGVQAVVRDPQVGVDRRLERKATHGGTQAGCGRRVRGGQRDGQRDQVRPADLRDEGARRAPAPRPGGVGHRLSGVAGRPRPLLPAR